MLRAIERGMIGTGSIGPLKAGGCIAWELFRVLVIFGIGYSTSLFAQPSITVGPTVFGNSPNSIATYWTTSTTSDSKVTATCAGGKVSSTVVAVHPFNFGTGWGVTQHGTAAVPIAVGVANNTSPTACSIVVTSCNAGGCATSSPVTSGTLAAIASQPIWFRQAGGVTKPNDQFDGRNGTALNVNCSSEGDTQYSTCNANGCFGIGQNGWGWNFVYAAFIQFINWNSAHSCPTGGLASGQNGYVLGATNYQPSNLGPISIRGAIYEGSSSNVAHIAGTQLCCFNLLKWPNGKWDRSISPQHNTGPAAPSVAGVDLPTGTNGMMADNTAVLFFPIQPFALDYGGPNGEFPVSWQAGMDGWVYSYAYFANTATPNILMVRCRVEDWPIGGVAAGNQWQRCGVYTGAQAGDDGLYDAAWTTMAIYTSGTRLIGDGTGADPYASMTLSIGNKPGVGAFPDASRFIMAVPVTTSEPAANAGIALYDLGQWPWGKPSGPIGHVPRDLTRDPYYLPAFPQWSQIGYQVTKNAVPLQGMVVMSPSGQDIFKGTTSVGVKPNQSQDGSAAWNVPLQWVVGTQTFTLPDTTSPAPLVYYDFNCFSGSISIADRSGNGFTINNGFLNYCDNFGWYNSGFATTLPSIPVYAGQQNKSLGIPYHVAQTSFTLIDCFGHLPGPPVGPIVSGESALSDSGGNMSIARSGTTATWNVSFRGTTLGAVPIADGTVGCIMIDRDGSNAVRIYSDDGLRPVTPQVLFGPTTLTGSWTPNLTVGAGSASLHGVESTLAIWAHLTDAQKIAKMNDIRKDFQTRRIPIQ